MPAITITKHIAQKENPVIFRQKKDYGTYEIEIITDDGTKLVITTSYASVKVEMPDTDMCISCIRDDSIIIGRDKI